MCSVNSLIAQEIVSEQLHRLVMLVEITAVI